MDAAAVLEALRRRGGETELFQGSSDSLEVRFNAGEVKDALARESSGLGVRAIRDGRLGFTCSRDLSPDGLTRLLTHVESALEVGDPAEYSFPGPSADGDPGARPDLGTYDEATAALGVAELVAAGQDVLAALRARHPDVHFDARVRRSVGAIRLENTHGLAHTERTTAFSLSVEANRTRDDDVLLDHAYRIAPSRDAVSPGELVEELSRRLRWADATAALRPARMPILFSPAGSALVWSPLLQALSGSAVMLGTSPLRERLGEELLDPRIELTDDGTLPGALGSSHLDDEGTPRRRRALIEDGVLRGFVHGLETAQATGQAPTGNGERGGVTGKPGPGFSNVLVRGGASAQAELLGGIRSGLLIHSVIGMGQGNTLPGDFSNPIDLAYLIEDGEVRGRVRDVSLAGNVYELLRGRLGGLSREVEQVGGSWRLPWLLLEDVNVVGKGSAEAS